MNLRLNIMNVKITSQIAVKHEKISKKIKSNKLSKFIDRYFGVINVQTTDSPKGAK